MANKFLRRGKLFIEMIQWEYDDFDRAPLAFEGSRVVGDIATTNGTEP
jgi:hypothetical protein